MSNCLTCLTGKRLSDVERAAWHPDVNVRFQPKAWYDEEQCELYALNEMKEITKKARAAKEESVAIFDNLSGQTTARHLRNLVRNWCKRHLLPGQMTDAMQLIDDGVGFSLKHEIGAMIDEWLMEEGHLEKWTAEGKGFPMWEKRVLITQLAAKAWEKVCGRFDFDKAATRLGMRMTVDGSDDQFIKVKGIDDYTFTDADGGDAGALSDEEGVDPEEEEEEEADVVMADSSDEEAEEGDDEYEDGDSSEDDEEDDTAQTVRSVIGDAVAPKGYYIIGELPPLDSEHDLQELIGRPVLVGWETAKAMGWFMSTIQSRKLSSSDLKKTPTANFVVKYASAKTNKKLNGAVACELTARTHGVSEWWVLLQKGATE